VVAHGERAEDNDDRDRGVRDQVEDGPEGTEQPCLGDLRPVDLRGLLLVAGGRLRRAAEGLEDAYAGRGLLDERGEIAFLVLVAP
jgi:hypothetical protein